MTIREAPSPKEIALHYGLPVHRVSYDGGEVWNVETDREVFSLWLSDDSSEHDRDRKVAVLQFLAHHGYEAPRVLPNANGGAITTWNQTAGYLTTKSSGDTPDHSAETFYALGVATGRLHGLDPKESDIPETGFNVPSKRKHFESQDADPTIRTWEAYSSVREEIVSAWDRLSDLRQLPQALLNTHVTQWGVAETIDGVSFCNWEDAGTGAAILDIGVLLGRQAVHPGPAALRCEVAAPFFEGYLSQRPLGVEEVECLPEAMVFGQLSRVISIWQGRVDEESWWRTRHILENLDRLAHRLREVCDDPRRFSRKFGPRKGFVSYPRPTPDPGQFRDRYGFTVDSIRRLSGSQRAWLVESSEESWVLRLHDPLLQENHPSEIASLMFLERMGHPAPRLIRTVDDDFLVRWGGHAGYTTTFLPGERIESNLDTIREVGSAIARVHVLDVRDSRIPTTKFSVTHRRARYLQLESDPVVQGWEGFSSVQPELARMWSSLPEFTDLPRVLTHTDLLLHNLIRYPDGDLVLIDWEGAGVGPATQDIGYFLRQYAIPPGDGGLRLDVSRAFFEGYTAVRTLSPAEWKAIPDAMIFTSIFCALWYEQVHEPGFWRTRYVSTHREQIAEKLNEIRGG